MSAIARPGFSAQKGGPALRLLHASVSEVSPMRERLAVIRDTMIVLSLQLVFRTVTMLRRWRITEF